jgi:hypothetical protein
MFPLAGMYKLICLPALLVLIGCEPKPTILPPSDPALRRTTAQFASDAKKRHPYKADAPRGGEAPARAAVGYELNQIDIVNLSREPWTAVEIWVNRNYVVYVPVMSPNDLKTIHFEMLFDAKGKSFPTNNKNVLVDKVEVYKDEKMFDVPVRLGD